MKKRNDILAFWIMSVLGLSIWLGISLLTGRQEAWDSPLYFKFGLPTMVIASALAGFIRKERFWFWGVAIVWMQPVCLIFNVGFGSMFVPGILLFLVFASICAFAAFVGGKIKRKK